MTEQIDRTSHFEQALAAIEAGDLERARDQVDRARRQASELKEYSIRWIAELLSFIADHDGEGAVETALRRFGDRNLRWRADPSADWWAVPAEVRAKLVARAMLANGAEVEVSEDDEKIVLAFRCGTGGWLLDSGAYEGAESLTTLRSRGPRTFDRDELPIYCAHCSINNEIQSVEWTGQLTTVEHPPARPGEPCVHHVYRRVEDIPVELYDRIGTTRPDDDAVG